jgi:biopolymer transport protein ExbB/TolQ
MASLGQSLQAIIYGVATVLLYPVLAADVIALAAVAFETGWFSVEVFRRGRSRRGLNVVALANSDPREGDPALRLLKSLTASPVATQVRATLGDGTDLSRPMVLKALADAEIEASRRLERTRMLVRIGPILGLMGTLIPISPALVALAQGDVDTLSNNLVIAFSTTVVGLLIGGLAYVMTTVRDATIVRTWSISSSPSTGGRRGMPDPSGRLPARAPQQHRADHGDLMARNGQLVRRRGAHRRQLLIVSLSGFGLRELCRPRTRPS